MSNHNQTLVNLSLKSTHCVAPAPSSHLASLKDPAPSRGIVILTNHINFFAKVANERASLNVACVLLTGCLVLVPCSRQDDMKPAIAEQNADIR